MQGEDGRREKAARKILWEGERDARLLNQANLFQSINFLELCILLNIKLKDRKICIKIHTHATLQSFSVDPLILIMLIKVLSS